MKVKLTPELDKKYGSQLEYMGHNNLTSMELSDGNSAIIEDDDFYIIFKPVLNTLPLTISYLENEYIGKVLGTFKNSFIPDEFNSLHLRKDKNDLRILKPIVVIVDADEDLDQIMTLTLSYLNKSGFKYFVKEIIPGIKIVEIRDITTDNSCFLVFSKYQTIKQTLVYAMDVVLSANIKDIKLNINVVRNRFGSAGNLLFEIDIMKLDITEI